MDAAWFLWARLLLLLKAAVTWLGKFYEFGVKGREI